MKISKKVTIRNIEALNPLLKKASTHKSKKDYKRVKKINPRDIPVDYYFS